jgi:hypothetical protein
VSTSTQGLDNDEQKTSIRVKTLPHAYEDSVELHDDPLPEPVPEPLEPETRPCRSLQDRSREIWDNQKRQNETEAVEYGPGPPSDQKHSKLPDPDISVTVTCPLPTSSKIRRDIVGCNNDAALFFCHAQLYILGDKYDVRPLKMLSSERLSRSSRHYDATQACLYHGLSELGPRSESEGREVARQWSSSSSATG